MLCLLAKDKTLITLEISSLFIQLRTFRLSNVANVYNTANIFENSQRTAVSEESCANTNIVAAPPPLLTSFDSSF